MERDPHKDWWPQAPVQAQKDDAESPAVPRLFPFPPSAYMISQLMRSHVSARGLSNAVAESVADAMAETVAVALAQWRAEIQIWLDCPKD